MQRPVPRDASTVDMKGQPPFPEPVAVISLRNTTVYRAIDDDGAPIMVLTDGVTTVALESGLSGPSDEVVVATERLADAVRDYATSVRAGWLSHRQPRDSSRDGEAIH